MGPRLREIKDSVELPPSAPKPPALIARWGPVVAAVVGCLTLGGILRGYGDGRWESRAHAQETATQQAAKVEAAKVECKQSLEATVSATRAELVNVQVRLARLEVSSQWQEAILRQIARKLDVGPTVPTPPPAAAPVAS